MKSTMKKSWKNLGFIIFLLCFISFSLAGFAVTYGDVNNDSLINIVDALMTAQYTAGLNPNGFQNVAADVNGDGIINIVDALLIARYSANLIVGFPVNTVTPTPTPTCASCTFTVSGKIADQSGQPISGASIFTAYGTSPDTHSDAQGNYSLLFTAHINCQVSADTFLRAEAIGYQKQESFWFGLNTCSNQIINITLIPSATPTPTPTAIPTPTPTCERCLRYMSGTVTNTNGQALAGAEVYELSTLIMTTDAQGKFSYSRTAIKPSLYVCPTGDTYLIIKAAGYQDMSRFVTVDCGTYTYNFTLNPATPIP